MASVSSLDKDLRGLRLEKYTPQLADEAREWIEEALGSSLKAGDLLAALKDGIALCKLINLVTPNGARFKESSMPFVQMENISHFLRACQAPPLNLHPHDVFLTVDLYEAKDPAQVLLCIGAFSRRANALQPARFPRILGKAKGSGTVTPQNTGGGTYSRGRGASNASESSTSTYNPISRNTASPVSRTGNTSSPAGGISSWSKRSDETATAPAWNIHQYGYMGGASQGNQGISFGGRRQITTPAPQIPSLAEKERKRREKQAEEERARTLEEESAQKKRVEREAEEERARLDEERRWEEETAKRREQERRDAEEEKRRWVAEERQWKEDEEKRRQEKEIEAHLASERERKRAGSDARLKGQFLSQYQSEQRISQAPENLERISERERVAELERQLAEAKEREARYEQERLERMQTPHAQQKTATSAPTAPEPPPARRTGERDVNSWDHSERDFLRQQHAIHAAPPSQNTRPLPLPQSQDPPPQQPARPLPSPELPAPKQPPRPLPSPRATDGFVPSARPLPDLSIHATPSLPSRPLPDPAAYANATSPTHASTPSFSPSFSTQSHSQVSQPPRSPGSSLLEREMERERLRQQEWEASQKQTADAAARGVRDGGSGPGESWDVHQYGYLGGDSQNRGSQGVNMGAARRQILGPRPLEPGK